MSFRKYFSSPYHFNLLILYFVLHGYTENIGLVSMKDLLGLAFLLLLIGMISFWLMRKILKDAAKAGVFDFLLLLIVLFFGVGQDFLAGNPFTATIARMKYLFPITCLLGLFIFWVLKRSKRSFSRLNLFLTFLMLIYLLIDIAKLAGGRKKEVMTSSPISPFPAQTLPVCDTCSRPDIYMIVLDEYMGMDGLEKYFHYSNGTFAGFLQEKGFKSIARPRSNYYFTVFSMASMLNMAYLPGLGWQDANNTYGYQRSLSIIKRNPFCLFLKKNGYELKNFSMFDLPDQPAAYYNSFVPLNARLITDKTLYNRLMKDLPFVLANKFRLHWFIEWLNEDMIHNNEMIMQRSLQPGGPPGLKNPIFQYVHLMMPHEPFAFDSMGRKTGFIVDPENPNAPSSDSAYLQYLVYTNKRVERYIDRLMEITSGKAIILLMSDHGYRGVGESGNKEQLQYSVLNALYLPDGNYLGWYDEVSHVNHLRILLNTEFGQHLPLLKDSCVH